MLHCYIHYCLQYLNFSKIFIKEDPYLYIDNIEQLFPIIYYDNNMILNCQPFFE